MWLKLSVMLLCAAATCSDFIDTNIINIADIMSNCEYKVNKACAIDRNPGNTIIPPSLTCITYTDPLDFNLKIERLNLSAHTKVVAAAIPYFDVPAQDMDGRIKELLKQKLDPSTVLNVLVYAYTRTLNINDKNVRNLLKVSSFLKIKPVVNACLDFLRGRIDANNVVDITNFAKSARNTALILAAEAYILNNFAAVTNTRAFLEMSSDDFLKILRSNEIRNVSEEVVFEASYRWLQHRPAERAGLQYKVMEHVRLNLLDFAYLSQNVTTKFIKKDNSQIHLLIDLAIESTLSTNKRKDLQGCRSWPRDGTNKFLALHWFYLPNMMQLYDQVADTLQTVAKPPPRTDYCVVVENCILYAISGKNSNEVRTYNPKSDSWKTIEPMIKIHNHAAAAAVNGVIYVSGGISSGAISSTEAYNTLNRSWTQLPSMSQPRYDHRLIEVDDHLYAIGGIDGNVLKSVEKFDISKQKWRNVKPMLNPRYLFGAALLNRKIYVCGGYPTSSMDLAEVYDPIRNTWTLISKMITKKALFSLVPYKEQLWAFKGTSVSTEVYDPTTNSWTSKPSQFDKGITEWQTVMINF